MRRDEPEVVGVQPRRNRRAAPQRFRDVERYALPVREAEVRVNGFSEKQPILRRWKQFRVRFAVCVEERARVHVVRKQSEQLGAQRKHNEAREHTGKSLAQGHLIAPPKAGQSQHWLARRSRTDMLGSAEAQPR